MNNTNPRKPHILLLFSDTGGGHRSVAEAIIETLHLEYDDLFTVEMVDFFKGYAPLPFNKMPDWYPDMVRSPYLWGAGYKITDGRLRARAITASMWPYIGRAAHSLVKSHPADLIVTVHPLATTAILKALDQEQVPFITVVTDWITNHALWFDHRSDLIIVPTEMAREGALRYGMEPRKVIVTGYPVAARHSAPAANKMALRTQLGWPLDKMVVLLLGGGEGMGPLPRTMNAINDSGLDLGLIVVTGKNEKLMNYLKNRTWKMDARIYGFTKALPDFMRAADAIITKAGAATVAESLNAGLPIIFHSRLPGQEDGNVGFVTVSGAGIWAPTPQDVVNVLTRWKNDPSELLRIANNSRRIAQPDAARVIAHLIGDKVIKS